MNAHEPQETTGRSDLPVAGGPAGAGSPAVRLVATLALAGAIAGLLIVVVFQWAQPRILAYQALMLRQAIEEVLGDPARYETLYVVDGALSPQLPAGADSMALDKVYLGYNETDGPVGFAIVGAEAGFQDVVRMIFGYDAQDNRILGMKVLENKETPGLGDRIEKDSGFVGGFTGAATPIKGVKTGSGTGAEEEVDMITGATISSRVVIGIINHRLETLGPLLREHRAGGGS